MRIALALAAAVLLVGLSWSKSTPKELPIDRQSDCNCGYSYDTDSRIAGGSSTYPHKYPWQVYVSFSQGGFCSGTIISPKYALTARHCVGNGGTYSVYYGLHHSDRFREHDHVLARSVGHPSQDIALLRVVDGEFPFGPGDPVRPICLPPQDTDEDYAGQTAVASGWGDTSQNSGSSDELQEIELTIMDPSQCGGSSRLCAHDPGSGKSACNSDSGSPLQIRDEYSHRHYLVGVAVTLSGGCGGTNAITGYIRVTAYLDWIRENTQDSPPCDPTSEPCADRYLEEYGFNDCETTFAPSGYCCVYPAETEYWCARSCGYCECRDTLTEFYPHYFHPDQCRDWANAGYCQGYPILLSYCMLSCDACGGRCYSDNRMDNPPEFKPIPGPPGDRNGSMAPPPDFPPPTERLLAK